MKKILSFFSASDNYPPLCVVIGFNKGDPFGIFCGFLSCCNFCVDLTGLINQNHYNIYRIGSVLDLSKQIQIIVDPDFYPVNVFEVKSWVLLQILKSKIK